MNLLTHAAESTSLSNSELDDNDVDELEVKIVDDGLLYLSIIDGIKA